MIMFDAHINYTIERQAAILADDNRNDVINWLRWNDRNGWYTDDDRADEGWAPLTIEEAKNTMIEVIMDHQIPEGEGIPRPIAEAIISRPEHFRACWGEWAELCASDDFAALDAERVCVPPNLSFT